MLVGKRTSTPMGWRDGRLVFSENARKEVKIMATLEAIREIRKNVTPQITLPKLVDTGEEIIVKVKYGYPNLWFGRVFNVRADKQGNIICIDDC